MELADIGIERDVPIYVRAMVVTEDAICTAGQLDVIEETAPMRSNADWRNDSGTLVRAESIRDGEQGAKRQSGRS